MYCPLTACLSRGGQGPLRFLALVSLIRPRKCFFFFFPLAPSHCISLPSACGCSWF